MSEIPMGWTILSLDDIGRWGTGGTPSRTKPQFFGTGIPWIKSGDLPDGPIRSTEEQITLLGLDNSSAKRLPIGTVSMALYGATIGKLGILTFEATTNQACANVIPNSDVIETGYLFNYLLSQREAFIKQGQGGAQPNISQGIVRSHPIPVPPLTEQRRIVAKLEELFSELDAGVAALRRAQRRLARYRQALLQAAVTGELTREWREVSDTPIHHSRPTQNRPIKGGSGAWCQGPWQVPVGWHWVRFDEVFTCRLGKMLDKQKNTGKPHPYLRNASVRWGAFDLSDLELIRVRDEELEEVSAQVGDLIICEGGEPGRCAVWKSEEPIVIQKALHRAKPMAGVLSEFFAYHLEHDCLSNRINELFTGTTIKHLTGRKLAEHLIVLPPEPEQQAILAELDRRLSAADALEATLQASLRHVERLRQSTLERAFRGELVPQDPNDEPAEALLARLRAATADAPAPRRRGPSKAQVAPVAQPLRRRGRPRKQVTA